MSNRRDSKGRILRSGESQRKDGRYMYQYTDITGRRRTIYSRRLEPKDKYPPDSDKKEPSLREREAEVIMNRQNGLLDFGGDMTMLELAEKYVATRTGVRESTRTGYRTVLNFLRNEPIAHTRIDRVKLLDVKLWMVNLQQNRGLHYSTLHTIRGVLRPAFQLAVDDDLIRKNPFSFRLADVIRNDSEVRHPLKPREEEEFLRFILEDSHFRQYYEVIYILLNTGLRISEFCGLTPKEVDFKKHCIHVNGQLVRHSNMITSFEPPKTEKGYRSVPMSAEVERCFRTLARNRKKVTVEPVIDGHAGFYFLDANGHPTVALHWEHYFNHIVSKYNSSHAIQLPNVTPHVCRHTFSTKMARMGMNPKTLQYIMGHSDISVTLDIYTEFGFDDAIAEHRRVLGEEEPQSRRRRAVN